MRKGLYLLDTSAVLILLGDEPGAGRVEEILRSEEVLLPFVVLVEAYNLTLGTASVAEAKRRHALLKALPAWILWEADEAVVLGAAKFKAAHRLPLADALVAAFAAVRGATLVHRDRHFDALAGELPMERLP